MGLKEAWEDILNQGMGLREKSLFPSAAVLSTLEEGWDKIVLNK